MNALLAVDPVPWARAQMAFTLGVHIILVPLGVSWAAMALIANYRGLRKNDPAALELAQRWSKYMAVTFAVGAVTGTVLTFEQPGVQLAGFGINKVMQAGFELDRLLGDLLEAMDLPRPAALRR